MSARLTETQRFIDPLNIGYGRDFKSIQLPSFDRTRLDVTNVERVTEIFHDPLGLKDRLRPMNLLWVGITGDLMPRFGLHSFNNLFEAIPGLKDNLQIFGVGTRAIPAGQAVVDDLKAKGLPLANYARFDDLIRIIEGGSLQVDGVFVASPPSEHLEHTLQCIRATNGNVQIFCEKPLVVPNQLNRMLDLSAAHPNVIVPVDFFATATPLYYLLTTASGQEILSKIGAPRVINGSLVETQPVEHERLGGNFGLLNLEKAGGGIMLDCGVHSLAMALIFKMAGGRAMGHEGNNNSSSYHAPHTYLDQKTIDGKLGASAGISLNDLRETGGVLSRVYGDNACVINAQGAKGVAQDMYLLDVLTDKGYRLVVGVGTDFQPPYLSVTSPDGQTEMKTFDTPSKEVGYGGAFYAMFAQMLMGNTVDIIPSNQAMLTASTDAIRDLATVNLVPSSVFRRHRFGEMPQSAIPLPLEIQDIVPRKGANRR